MSWDYNPFAERALPPMSPDLFTTLVTARLRSLVDVEIESHQLLELQLRVRGAPLTAQLERYYARYRSQPEALTPILDQFIQTIAEGKSTTDPAPDSFSRVAPQLFPLLMSAREWMEKREQGLRAVIRPLVQELGIALVIDEGAAINFVQFDAIPRWGLEAASAYERANENLDLASQWIGFSEIGDGPEKILVDRATDGYAATRVILPSRLQEWARRVKGELVLGIPYRDFLVGFSRAHPNIVELRAQVARDYHAQPHALLPHLLVLRNGILEILEEGTVFQK